MPGLIPKMYEGGLTGLDASEETVDIEVKEGGAVHIIPMKKVLEVLPSKKNRPGYVSRPTTPASPLSNETEADAQTVQGAEAEAEAEAEAAVAREAAAPAAAAPDPNPNPDAASWQDLLRRQQEELERLRERLAQIEAVTAPVAVPLTAAVLAAIELDGANPSSSSDDDALSVAPSTAQSVVTTATHLRNECEICLVKVPNAMCKPCGCVKFCQHCIAKHVLKTKGTRRACPHCGKGLEHYVKLR